MNRRKELINDYKERELHGGVYKITNTINGKYLIDHAANPKSVQNRFQFAMTTGSTLHPKLKNDWEELGAQAFTPSDQPFSSIEINRITIVFYNRRASIREGTEADKILSIYF